MSFMFEVLYKSPPDPRREAIISERDRDLPRFQDGDMF